MTFSGEFLAFMGLALVAIIGGVLLLNLTKVQLELVIHVCLTRQYYMVIPCDCYLKYYVQLF